MMGATDQIGTAAASSCCRAVSGQVTSQCGLAAFDGQNGRCGALGQFGHGSGLDRQLKCHFTNFCSRVGNAQIHLASGESNIFSATIALSR